MSRQPPPGADAAKIASSLSGEGPGNARLSAGESGEFPIRIARDGAWFYRGSRIGRKALARLFSTVLHRDGDGRFWLITPFERGMIEVEDAPFTAVELAATGCGKDMSLRFRTNFDDWVTAGPGHPISVAHDAATGEPSPYIRVRDNLDALILRPVFYELAEIAEPAGRDGAKVLGVWSGGEFFELGPAE